MQVRPLPPAAHPSPLDSQRREQSAVLGLVLHARRPGSPRGPHGHTWVRDSSEWQRPQPQLPILTVPCLEQSRNILGLSQAEGPGPIQVPGGGRSPSLPLTGLCPWACRACENSASRTVCEPRAYLGPWSFCHLSESSSSPWMGRAAWTGTATPGPCRGGQTTRKGRRRLGA